MKTLKDHFVSLCMITGTTGVATRVTGVGYFLPQLFKLRYAKLGGVAPEVISQAMAELTSFDDAEWCAYWNALADRHEAAANRHIAAKNTAAALQELRIAISYLSISAFPGTTPARIAAYRRSKKVFQDWLKLQNSTVKAVSITCAGQVVEGYLWLPEDQKPCPMMIITNGLEGTAPELMVPLMDYVNRGIALFVMEMPGTYSYAKPMNDASEQVYAEVIEHFAANPRIDAKRIGLLGLSFGAYWATRMAATSTRLRCVIANGAPLAHSFSTLGTIGVPEIMIQTLKKVSGSNHILALRNDLHKLTFAGTDYYERIKIPLLVINGDTDTLCSTQDSVDLAERVPTATLKLYENDDHCAVGHYEEMMAYCFDWMAIQLK
ncbi:MAG: alpha/beta hydrolase [Pseudomonadota bacterium]